MHKKFDADIYRSSRLTRKDDDPQVFQDMMDGLGNRENLALWKQGIISPPDGEASLHFKGFRTSMIERAAMESSVRGKDRSLEACVEHMLDPEAVQKFVDAHDAAERLDIKLERQADTFLRERAKPFVNQRSSPRP